MKIDELESAIGNVKMVLDQAGRGAPGRDLRLIIIAARNWLQVERMKEDHEQQCNDPEVCKDDGAAYDGCNFHIALEVAKALAGHEYLRAAADLDMLYRRRIVLLHKGNKSAQEIHEGIRRMQQKLGIKSQLTK